MTRAEAPAATYRERKGAGKIMSRQPVSVEGRAAVAGLRNELLGRLGLRENASDADVETAHNGLVEFLELAPREVKSWATARTTDVDEAFALLSGPEAELIAATQTAPTAAVDLPKDLPPPLQPPPRQARSLHSRQTSHSGTRSLVRSVPYSPSLSCLPSSRWASPTCPASRARRRELRRRQPQGPPPRSTRPSSPR